MENEDQVTEERFDVVLRARCGVSVLARRYPSDRVAGEGNSGSEGESGIAGVGSG